MTEYDRDVLEIPTMNDARWSRLLAFADDVLHVSASLGLDPILDGGLAVLAHTRNSEMSIGDVDFSLDERHFSEFATALKQAKIHCEIQPWHVLQARRDDLKVEFGDTETWAKGLSGPYLRVRLGNHVVRMINRQDLHTAYKRGAEALASEPEVHEKLAKIESRLRLLEGG